MNQSIAPVIAARATANMDSPDVLFVLRRYAWLLVAGTVLGAFVSYGLYIYFRDHIPRYRASYGFQVLPPPTPIGQGDQIPIVFNSDDANQFIHRQANYIKQTRILQLMLQSKEFQTDHNQPDNAGSRSQWLTENWSRQLERLKRDLQVTPMVDSAMFEISMTCRDPVEAYTLVDAAQRIYLATLRSDNNITNTSRLGLLARAVEDQKVTVQRATSELNQFVENRQITAITSRYKLEVDALQSLNVALINAEKDKASAEMNLANLKLNPDPNNPAILSADVQQFIDDNPDMRSLKYTRLSLDQEMAALIARGQASTIDKRMLDARRDKVDEQIETLRKDLNQRAVIALQQRAENTVKAYAAQVENIQKAQKEKGDEVKTLDEALIQYQQRVDGLKAQQEILDRISRQYSLLQLAPNTDDARVQLIVQAVQPEAKDFVWPSLKVFMPLGILSGAGLSFLLAYLLVWTDTRVRTPRDITKTLQLPLLGFIPDESDDRDLTGDVATALVSSPHSMISEAFRQIRSQLSAQTENSPVNTLLVASIAPGGGSTTVASNLAAGIALNDRRVLLVDANFYRPSLNALYKNVPTEGITDVLADPSILNSAIVPCNDVPKLHLLGAGSRLGKGSSELLEGKGFRDLLEQLRSRYDLVIFDGAPLNLVADSLTLAARVDGVISVIRAGEVSRGTVTRIREQLRQVHANLLGFILNAAQTSSTGYFKENYRTFYRYAGQGARRSTAGTTTR